MPIYIADQVVPQFVFVSISEDSHIKFLRTKQKVRVIPVFRGVPLQFGENAIVWIWHQQFQEFELSGSHVGQSVYVLFREVCDGNTMEPDSVSSVKW